MVILIPNNINPTADDIDVFIRDSCKSGDSSRKEHITNIIREIQSKSGAGALLHPAEEYFLEAATRSQIL